MTEGDAAAGSRLRPLTAVLLLAALYAGVSFTLSILRLEEFATSNWDLGIFQQALASTLHGHPMYEAGDWEFYGTRSFLEVHPSFVLYLLEPIYAISPTPTVLFAFQSIMAALAALPLYLIGRRILGRPWPAVGLAGAYLISAPLLTANLYDFHLELFLPLEISLLFYFWLEERYVAGVAVALVAFLTIEVTPFLVAALAVYFLLPSSGRIASSLRALLRRSSEGRRGFGRALAATARSWLEDRRRRWTVGLLALSVVGYVALRFVEWVVLPAVLPPAPMSPFGPVSPSATGLSLGLGFTGAFGADLGGKAAYWVLLMALFGFLPLLAPRVLILELPWFAYTVQSGNFVWTTLGFQYSAVAVTPLAIAAIFGYADAERRVIPRILRALGALRRAPASTVRRRPLVVRRLHRSLPASPTLVLALVLVLAAAANLWVGPLNPAHQRINSGVPGYNLQFVPTRGYADVVQLAALIPSEAPVLASSDVFPFVATDLHAYSLLWVPDQPPQLPFSPGAPPAYFLLASEQGYAVPTWLADQVAHHLYGLLGVVYVTPVGSVDLWQLDYNGPTSVIGPPVG